MDEFVCAVPDAVGSGGNCRWETPDITYAFTHVIPGLSEATMRAAVRDVFDHIESECGITAKETDSAANARILLTVAPLDGPGGVLADSMLPCGSTRQCRQRYDSRERQWVVVKTGPWPNGTMDFWRVCLHEICHALGLPHGGADIMKPSVDGNTYRIGTWTREELRRRYGPPKPKPTPTPDPGGGMFDLIKMLAQLAPVIQILIKLLSDPQIKALIEALMEAFKNRQTVTLQELVDEAKAQASIQNIRV